MISNSLFEGNRATQSLINLSRASLNIATSKFKDNFAEHETPGISLSLSTLNLRDSEIMVTEPVIVVPMNNTEIVLNATATLE